MACQAAKRHVVAALRYAGLSDSDKIWRKVGWWTPDTIQEALEELCEDGVVSRLILSDVTKYRFLPQRG